MFSMVVLPLPVPPEMSMLTFAFERPCTMLAISGVSVLYESKSSIFSGITAKRRIETTGPSSATGGMMAFTREPSGSRASDHRA